MIRSQARPGLRVAAAFLAALALGSGAACTAGRSAPRVLPAAKPSGEPFHPTARVERRPLLPADPDRDAEEGEFTGSASCADCHRSRVRSLGLSFHEPLLKGALDSVGCEECHGPAIDHVGDGAEAFIRHPRKAPREASNAVCLRCHAAVLERPVRGHPLWVEGRRNACVECHLVHFDRGERISEHGRGPFPDAASLEAAGARPVPPGLCVSCHPDFHPRMEESGHRDLMRKDEACGTCHGNGSLHADSGGLRDLILLPTRQDARAADAACASCHATGDRPLERWTCSEHRAEGVSCVTCHAPNEPLGATLRRKDPDLCVECHRDTASEFRLPSRHRVLEGWMTCSSCHDPHGNESAFHRFELTRTACLECHPEKGGPFVYDHTAKSLEGCVVCHKPHGSTGPRLMETRDVRTNCLACHPDLPRSHEQRPGSLYRNCIQCHLEIHGSDSDRLFFR